MAVFAREKLFIHFGQEYQFLFVAAACGLWLLAIVVGGLALFAGRSFWLGRWRRGVITAIALVAIYAVMVHWQRFTWPQ